MNWGYKIAILCLSFVAFMTFLVVSAFRQNFDLVAEDYYGKELMFQEQIEKQRNQQQLKEKVSLKVEGNVLKIKFPSELSGKIVEGEIVCFRPSDATKDVHVKIGSIRNGEKLLPLNLFVKGMYRIQVDYNSEGKKYYFEDSIIL
jgi:hypothetical protein